MLDTAATLFKAGTVVEPAPLILQTTPVIVSCRHCGIPSEVPANRLLCRACHSADTDLISGDELILASLALCVT